jgi:hypothetical protein
VVDFLQSGMPPPPHSAWLDRARVRLERRRISSAAGACRATPKADTIWSTLAAVRTLAVTKEAATLRRVGKCLNLGLAGWNSLKRGGDTGVCAWQNTQGAACLFSSVKGGLFYSRINSHWQIDYKCIHRYLRLYLYN